MSSQNNSNITFLNKIFFFGILALVAFSSIFPFLNWMTSWLALVLGIALAILLGNQNISLKFFGEIEVRAYGLKDLIEIDYSINNFKDLVK